MITKSVTCKKRYAIYFVVLGYILHGRCSGTSQGGDEREEGMAEKVTVNSIGHCI